MTGLKYYDFNGRMSRKQASKPKDDEEDKPVVNITRIDIAQIMMNSLNLMILSKTQKGHYRSSNTRNIVKTSDREWSKVSETIHWQRSHREWQSRECVFVFMIS